HLNSSRPDWNGVSPGSDSDRVPSICIEIGGLSLPVLTPDEKVPTHRRYAMKYQPQNWKTDFDDDGFIIVEDLIDPPQLLALRDGMDEIAGNFKHLPAQLQEKIFLEREHVKNSPEWYRGKLTPEECGVSVRQIDDLALFDQMFAQLICYPPLLDVL